MTSYWPVALPRGVCLILVWGFDSETGHLPYGQIVLSLNLMFILVSMLDVQSQVSNFMFSWWWCPVQRQGSPTLASSGRDSPASELDCHHNSQCPPNVWSQSYWHSEIQQVFNILWHWSLIQRQDNLPVRANCPIHVISRCLLKVSHVWIRLFP